MTQDLTSRREFLQRAGSAALIVAGSCGAARFFHNRHLVPVDDPAHVVGSFLVPGTEGRMAVAEGLDGAALVGACLQELGGITRFVKAGDRVLVKPNCAFDRPPHLGATTSPEVLAAVVALCVGAGAQVRVIDNPINDPEGCFVKSGLMSATQQNGGEVWLPTPRLFKRTQIGTIRVQAWEALYEPLNWATRVIGVPTVKTHNLCGATLGLKNWYGLLGGARSNFHQAIHEVIADLAQFIRPTLTILDGTRLLVRNGPTGGSPADVRPGYTVAAGTDPVAIDAFGAGLLNLGVKELPYLLKAQTLGLGLMQTDKLNLFRRVEVGR